MAARKKNLYGGRRIQLPTPQYYVFYNGTDEAEDRLEMKLSDAFADSSVRNQYEWTAVMLNINYGHNKELMEKCRILEEYAACIELVRECAKDNEDWRDAIRKAVDICIEKGILSEYLLRNKAEVVEMLLTEYNEQAVMEQLRNEYKEIGLEEGRQEGLQKGLQQGLQQGLSVLIEAYREMDIPKEIVAEKVRQKYKLTQEKTDEVMNLYW